MRVYIANFGKGNWAWQECLKRNALAVMDDVRVHPFWKARDKDGYIREAQKSLRQSDGSAVTKPVASRWYNLNDVLMETVGDLWIHREKDELWWTVSTNADPTVEIVDDPQPRFGPAKVYLYFKPSLPWSDKDKRGRPLSWNGLHPRSKEFLFTEGTFQCLSDDNAAYARALINGDDLSPWHSRADWKAKSERTGRFPVTHFDARQKTVARMAMTAFATCKASGSVATLTQKEKEFRFKDQYDLERHISGLLQAQEGLCALTGIQLLLDGQEGNPEFQCSLDRINSNGHYEIGNLQVVCRFANRWKSDAANAEFLNLIEAVIQASLSSSVD